MDLPVVHVFISCHFFLSQNKPNCMKYRCSKQVLLVLSKTNDSSDSSGTITSDGSKTIEPPMKRGMSVLDHLLSDEKKKRRIKVCWKR